MRYFFVLLIMINFSSVVGKEFRKNPENICKIAVNQNSDYKVSGIYGSSLESEWHPVSAYILLKEIYRFEVLRKEFRIRSQHVW